MADPCIVLPLKRFLVVAECPPDWRAFDLYLFRDDEVAFYAGQSHLAYARVWQHITDGYKARSVMGRFVLCNWPKSMRFSPARKVATGMTVAMIVIAATVSQPFAVAGQRGPLHAVSAP